MKYSARLKKFRKQLRLGKRELFLVTHLTNVHYLTGFSGSAGWLLVNAEGNFLLSDSRYETQIKEECPELGCEIRKPEETLPTACARLVRSLGIQVLHFETDSMSKGIYDRLASSLPETELRPTSRQVEQLRAIKDPEEIALIRQSIKINQRAFQVICGQLRGEQTEQELGHLLEHQMRLFGASGVSFDPLVAVGARAALPHAKPGKRKICEDSFTLIDWGTRLGGYASDLTRMVVTTKIPPKLRRIYEIVLNAQQAAIDQVAPGVPLQTVDRAARKVIEDSGFGKNFGHGTGHGIGLEIHEFPFVFPAADGFLAPGMVITIEPGIYLPGWGGVRIEDNILVTEDGRELLSDLPRQLDDCVVELL